MAANLMRPRWTVESKVGLLVNFDIFGHITSLNWPTLFY